MGIDIEAEAHRLEALGASRVADKQLHEHGTNWILMADPEGNEFCVCDGGANQPAERSRGRHFLGSHNARASVGPRLVASPRRLHVLLERGDVGRLLLLGLSAYDQGHEKH